MNFDVQVQLALIAIIPATLAAIFAGMAVVLGVQTAMRVRQVAEVAKRASDTGAETHMLVNGLRSASLLAAWTQLRRIAELTDNAQDKMLAVEALEAYREHQKQMAVITLGREVTLPRTDPGAPTGPV